MNQSANERRQLLELLANKNSLLEQESLTVNTLHQDNLALQEEVRTLRQENRFIKSELQELKSSLAESSILPPSRKPFNELGTKRSISLIAKICQEMMDANY